MHYTWNLLAALNSRPIVLGYCVSSGAARDKSIEMSPPGVTKASVTPKRKRNGSCRREIEPEVEEMRRKVEELGIHIGRKEELKKRKGKQRVQEDTAAIKGEKKEDEEKEIRRKVEELEI